MHRIHTHTGSRGFEAVACVVNDTRLGAGSHVTGGRRVVRRRQQDGHHLPFADRGTFTAVKLGCLRVKWPQRKADFWLGAYGPLQVQVCVHPPPCTTLRNHPHTRPCTLYLLCWLLTEGPISISRILHAFFGSCGRYTSPETFETHHPASLGVCCASRNRPLSASSKIRSVLSPTAPFDLLPGNVSTALV